MKTLYIDCGMGAAGDMLTAALLELHPDREGFLQKLNGLGIPGVTFIAERSTKCGINGTHIRVAVHGEDETEHMHDHHHHHGSMEDIRSIVSRLRIPTTVKLDILAVYEEIAQAESHVHGVPVEQIHFHEVGTMDAIADITAVCLLIHELKLDQILASAVLWAADRSAVPTASCQSRLLQQPIFSRTFPSMVEASRASFVRPPVRHC